MCYTYMVRCFTGSVEEIIVLQRYLLTTVCPSVCVVYSSRTAEEYFDKETAGLYRVAHEKPACRLVEQSGRRSRTLYRKLNKCKCKVLIREGAENDLLVRQCTFVHAAPYCHATQRCQFSELTPLICIACMTVCCSVHKSALTYKEIIFSTFSNEYFAFAFV